eukprot:symbB.v1.2.038481.t1/scaffold6004.1/size21842/3
MDIDVIWEALKSFGFNERKLALSNISDAEIIAEQVCAHFGCICESEYVKSVHDLIHMCQSKEPVRKRLRGDHLLDPLLLGGSTASSSTGADEGSRPFVPVSRVAESRQQSRPLGIKHRPILDQTDARDKREQSQREKWARILYLELCRAKSPTLNSIEHCVGADRIHLAVAGKTRTSTLKRYVKCWQDWQHWKINVWGEHVRAQPSMFCEYLFMRFDEPCGPTVPGLICKAVHWFEGLSGLKDESVTDNRVVIQVRDYIVEQLSKDGPPPRRAPRYPVVMLEAMEQTVLKTDALLGLRMVAWMKLVKTWGALRFDDLQKIKPEGLSMLSGRMTTTLRITKTSGPGKRMQELPVCISEHAYIWDASWLKTGFDLLKSEADFERDYLMPQLESDWNSFRKKAASYNDMSVYSCGLRRALCSNLSFEELIPDALACYWTEHSERATLPTGLAMIGIPKSDRDLVGRWKPDASDSYIRSYNGLVAKLQYKFSSVCRQEKRYKILDEIDVAESAQAWLKARKPEISAIERDSIIEKLESAMGEFVHGPESWIEEDEVDDDTFLRDLIPQKTGKRDEKANFFEHEITTISKFSSFFRDEADLVTVLRDEFALDAAASLADRAQVASVICAWKDTQTKSKRQSELEAEMDTREWTKPIPTGDYIQLKSVFITRFGLVEDKVVPAKEYIEKKLQELENGEFRAETLAEVVGKDEIDPDVLTPVFDSKGNLSVKKGSSSVPLPTGPEQLRRRLSIMQNCLMMLAIKHVTYEVLKDVSKDLFDRYKDYLLGDYVWGLTSTDLQGNQVQTPPWSLVLTYEQAIRKKAFATMQVETIRFGEALEKAWKLSWTERKKAEWGNILKEFTFEAIALSLQLNIQMILFENPEDLGAMQSGPYEGQRPASMWQDEVFEHMVKTGAMQTVGFYQQDFGTEYLKPTRLLLKGFDMHEAFSEGPPQFDEQGRYLGPLQKRQAAKQLIGQQNAKFNTTGTEQWPSDFCKWIAQQIFQHIPTSTSFGGGSSQGDVEQEVQQQYKILSPEGPKVRGGLGEPRVCRVPGKVKDFHDGAGLASPGRWDIENRQWNEENWVAKLRSDIVKIVVEKCGGFHKFDKVCFNMSVKGEAGCGMVKDEDLKELILGKMVEAISEQGVEVDGLLQIAEGQPFRLRLMQKLLQLLGDSDHLFLLDGEVGYQVGVLNPLPRTPHMYEEQTSWKLEDDPYMKEEIWRENYDSVGEHESFVREHFDAECAEGLMEKLNMEEAQLRFGDKIAISSLSVLIEETHGNKKRIIHDATHGTKINNRIKCTDKQRRTFGVASASYSWGRIAGAGLRLTHELLGPGMPVELLIFADDLEALGADLMGRRGVVMAYIILSALGFPFKWAKQRGGLDFLLTTPP